jgi:hypothetical protein
MSHSDLGVTETEYSGRYRGLLELTGVQYVFCRSATAAPRAWSCCAPQEGLRPGRAISSTPTEKNFVRKLVNLTAVSNVQTMIPDPDVE